MNSSLAPVLGHTLLNQEAQEPLHDNVKAASAMMATGAHPSDAAWWVLASRLWHRTETECAPTEPTPDHSTRTPDH
jgi:hypothetical protein